MAKFTSYNTVVFKVGTSTLTHASGLVNIRSMENLVKVLSDIKNTGRNIVLVSSGAIGVGVGKLGLKQRPTDTQTKQAVAAVGQCELMYIYDKLFSGYNHKVAQLLLTGDVLDDELRRTNVINTFSKLAELGCIPIVNENDTVAVEEIEFGDNDALSALVAKLIGADALVILSDIDGLYDSDPRKNKHACLIHEVPVFTRDIFRMAGGAGTSQGTGGMYTKIQAAEICVHSGIDMVIAKSTIPEVLERIMDGENIGTFFKGENVHPQLKKRDIIIGTAVKGKILVDEGCRRALLTKGSSLLPVGIIGTEGRFSEGDTVAVYCQNDEVARGITHYSSEDIGLIKGLHTEQLKEGLGMEPPYDTVIHRDNLLVMK